MTAIALVLGLALGLATSTAPQAPPAQPAEIIAEIQVHGNHVTSDADLIAMAGITIGAPFTAETLAQVKAKLKAGGKFEDVDVLKRYASIADPTKITVVIIVNEGAVNIEFEKGADGEEVAVVKRRGGFGNLMFLPILDAEDGYGLTYGVTASLADVAGKRSRLSFPLSWGGTRRAAVELEKNFVSGPLTRVEIGGAIQRRTNPAYDEHDGRRRAWARAERALGYFRLGATAGWERVSFGPLKDDLKTAGGDITFDTRIDPTYPRNAVLATAGLERVSFKSGGTLQRTHLDGRGYLGLIKQSVLAVRVMREGANAPQPAYLRPLLGGWSNLRGFEAGAFVGDIVVAGSAELLVPLSSPLSVGRLGVSVFVDTGVAYDYGQRLKDQARQTGIGGSVWMTATVFRVSLSVAHGRGAGTRVNFGGGLTF
ncbi:MAG TPA: BamA/TamA family outer membrane protein [Vicinamibacterales bacterium]|nr:BamA/TamA family outer membrane protein [Vicinamibacterales bacterium]